MRLGEFIYDLLNFAIDSGKTMFDGLNKVGDLVKIVQDIDFIKFATVASTLKKRNMSKIELEMLEGSGIALTNNEVKDTIKANRSLEKREIFINVTTIKIVAK